ncbi:MAG: CBS domain-containing protein [Dehalococcoidia bacterium]
MQVSEVMTKDAIGIQVGESATQAARLMRDHDVECLLVYAGAELAGS